MPQYLYKCPTCMQEIEIIHDMSECENPKEETVIQITCNSITCNAIQPGYTQETNGTILHGRLWERVPNWNGSFLSFGSGDKMKGGTLSKEEKQKKLRQRSDTIKSKKEIELRKESDIQFKKQAKDILNGKR